METKNCKQCGSELNSNAVICLQCGKDQRSFFVKNRVVLITIAIIFAIGLVGSGGENTISTNTDVEQNDITPKEDAVEVVVADFSTMSKTDIQTWCDTNQIKYTITEEYSNTIEKGKLITQSASANSTIKQGDKIKIVYSLGKQPSTEYKNALKKAESY